MTEPSPPTPQSGRNFACQAVVSLESARGRHLQPRRGEARQQPFATRWLQNLQGGFKTGEGEKDRRELRLHR